MNRSTPTTQERDALLDGIARRILQIETLETRKSDALDFHDLAVWNIRQALMTAYESGYDHANTQEGM